MSRELAFTAEPSAMSGFSISTGTIVDRFPLESMGSNALNHFYAANANTKLFADAGQVVTAQVSTMSFSGAGALAVAMSGYFVPAP